MRPTVISIQQCRSWYTTTALPRKLEDFEKDIFRCGCGAEQVGNIKNAWPRLGSDKRQQRSTGSEVFKVDSGAIFKDIQAVC